MNDATKLKLGKGVAFVKSRLKRLKQEKETWEVDFRAIPKPIMQSNTGYVGMVLTQPDGFLLADSETQDRPTVNDLASLLAHAMGRPLIHAAHRPTRILLRGHPQWQELLPHLLELGIEVSVEDDLPQIEVAFAEFLQHMQNLRRGDIANPTPEQVAIESLFPAVTRWVNGGYGQIEIGDQDGFGFMVRATDAGGVIFEDETASTLVEGMVALETELREWLEQNGVDRP